MSEQEARRAGNIVSDYLKSAERTQILEPGDTIKIPSTLLEYTPQSKTSVIPPPIAQTEAPAPKTLVETIREREEPISAIREAKFAAFDEAFGMPPEVTVERDIVVDPALKSDLQDITNRNDITEAVPKGKKNAKPTDVKAGNWFERMASLTFGGMMDALRVKGLDLSSFVRGVRGNNIAYADKIVKAYVDRNPIDWNEKRVVVADEDIIGGRFPNNQEGRDIVEAEDLPIIKQKFEQKFDDLTVGLTKKEEEALRNIGWNEEMYILMSDDQAKLDKYFTPEYQQKMREKIEMERIINDTIGQMLVERGLITQKQFEEKEYVRFYLSDAFLNSLGKGKYTIDLFGDGPRDYDSPLDALRALDAMRSLKKQGRGKDIKINEEEVTKLESIFKTKGNNLDKHRFHSPTLRTMNYAKFAGKALRDADLLKMFEEIGKSKDTKVKESLANMLGSTSL